MQPIWQTKVVRPQWTSANAHVTPLFESTHRQDGVGETVSSSPPALVRGSENFPHPSSKPVVTIGNFDGVHKGHRHLLAYVQGIADALNRPTAVYTFDPAPRDVLQPDNNVPRIQTLDDKVSKLHRLGVNHVIVEPFTLAFAQHEAKWFATEIIGRRLGASALIVGWDFHFGRNRAGNYDNLKAWLDFPVYRFEAVKNAGEVVSSSRIRDAVRAGNMKDANHLLEHTHEIVGRVTHGDGRGKELGYPTANIRSETQLIPADGVYAVRLERQTGEMLDGVANIGTRPTFDLQERTIEVHLLKFDGDLYNERVRVQWIQRIRGEKRFATHHELMQRIALDSQLAIEILHASDA